MGRRKTGKEIECPECRKMFYVKGAHLKFRVYCSLDCRNKGYTGRTTPLEIRERKLGGNSVGR